MTSRIYYLSMKRLIILTIVMLYAITTQAQIYYGQVKDPDGYTNIRSGPSTKHAIKTRYNSGDYLYYTPQDNGWSKVYSGTSSNTYMGYMHSSRIVKVNPNEPSVSPSHSSSSTGFKYGLVKDPDGYTNIRRGPSTRHAICRRYNSGDYLYYVSEGNGWSKVYSDNSISTYMGYMHTSRIEDVKSTPSTSLTPKPFTNSFKNYFQYNDNRAYKVILRAAHPSNTFISGDVSVTGNDIYVTIYSKDSRHSNLCATFRLRKDGAYFNSIECTEDDDLAPAFFFTDMLTSLFGSYIDTIEKVNQIEGYFGVKLSNMSAQKGCLAVLSVLFWNYTSEAI